MKASIVSASKPGAGILDVGCRAGWTSLFLAESGYCPTGIDIAPAHIDMAVERAARWDVERRRGVTADFIVADMDRFSIPKSFDAALVFDALHHSARQDAVVGNIAAHLTIGAWVLFGEPSWLHRISPHARRVTRDYGFIERGITLRSLKRSCSRHGLGCFRRFHEGTRPYESQGREFLWELIRLVAGNFFVSPQTSIWLAAQRIR
jgi:SAM-dependent methyltransferase